MLRGVVTLVHLVDIERDFHMEKNRSQNPSSKSVRASPSDHRYYAAAVVGITPPRPPRGRSAAAPPQSYSTFWRRQLKGEREREKGGNGKEGERQTQKKSVRLPPRP